VTPTSKPTLAPPESYRVPADRNVAAPRVRFIQTAGGSWPAVVALIGFVACWELACRFLGIAEYLVPRPSHVVVTIFENQGLLLSDALVTLCEAVSGLALAFVVAVSFAIGFVRFQLLERALLPYVVAFQAVPMIAIAPLLILWFGSGLTGKVVMAAVICFFPATVTILRGLRTVDPDALLLLRSLSASPLQTLVKLRIPTALPYVFTALRISATLSVTGALVAELAGANMGLGFRIVISSYRTDTTMLFAALICAVLLGMGFYGLVAVAERVVRRYRPMGQVL
jgi:NitT/TauT family transport system permease protein